jgi:hypothetical protein
MLLEKRFKVSECDTVREPADFVNDAQHSVSGFDMVTGLVNRAIKVHDVL